MAAFWVSHSKTIVRDFLRDHQHSMNSKKLQIHQGQRAGSKNNEESILENLSICFFPGHHAFQGASLSSAQRRFEDRIAYRTAREVLEGKIQRSWTCASMSE